jgi:hypothetical protein
MPTDGAGRTEGSVTGDRLCGVRDVWPRPTGACCTAESSFTCAYRSHVSYPTSEPAREQRVNAPVPRAGLFSHSPEAEVVEQRRPVVGDRVDSGATLFSAGAAGHRRSVALDEE